MRARVGAGSASATEPWGIGRRDTSMSALKWLLMTVGAALFGSAGALVGYDIYLAEQLRRLLSRNRTDESGAEPKAGTSRNRRRNGRTPKINFLDGCAGTALRQAETPQ